MKLKMNFCGLKLRKELEIGWLEIIYLNQLTFKQSTKRVKIAKVKPNQKIKLQKEVTYRLVSFLTTFIYSIKGHYLYWI